MLYWRSLLWCYWICQWSEIIVQLHMESRRWHLYVRYFADGYSLSDNPQKSVNMCIAHMRSQLTKSDSGWSHNKWDKREKHVGNINILWCDLKERDEIIWKKVYLIVQVNHILVSQPYIWYRSAHMLLNSSLITLSGAFGNVTRILSWELILTRIILFN